MGKASQVKSFVLSVWNDPVGSKVIAGAILPLIAAAWALWDWNAFLGFTLKILGLVQVPILLLLILGILSMASIYRLIGILLPKRNRQVTRPLITNEEDIKAVLDTWWQNQIVSDKDVTVDFQQVDTTLCIVSGGTSRHVGAIASNNGYKQKYRGETLATYALDVSAQFSQFGNRMGFA